MNKHNFQNVAIIGAGPSGLCAARHLTHNQFNNQSFKIVIFERQDCLGGLWVYDETKYKDRNDNHVSPIYKDMRTNLPKQVMCYPDFPFPKESLSFPHHTVVRKYINDYAENYDVRKFIRFKTEVLNISPIINNPEERYVKWSIKSKDLISGITVDEEFDGVILCSGIFSTPLNPSIDGIENFKGEVLHSKWYNKAEDYKDKTVVILGYGPTAVDILVGICKESKMVYVSKRSEGCFQGTHPNNVKLVPIIRNIDTDGNIIFDDGLSIHADVLLLCTGYIFSYPFLSPECKIEIKEEGKVVTPLYKHIFNIAYPSMAVVGLPIVAPIFGMMHQQCSYIASVFCGSQSLPSEDDMRKSAEKEISELTASGLPYKALHVFELNCFKYGDDLAELSGNKKNPEIVKKLFLKTYNENRENLYTFKCRHYKQLDSNSFEVLI